MQPKRSTLALRPPPKNADAFVTGDGQRSTPDVERPALESVERPATERSGLGTSRPAPDVDALAPAAQRPPLSAQPPALDVDAPALTAQRPPSSAHHSALNVDAPAPAVQRPPSSAQRSASSVERPNIPPPSTSSRPASNVERPAFAASQDTGRSPDVERPTSLPSFSRGSKAVIERKKGAMRRTSVYLQMSTAAALAEYCGAQDVEMSAVVDEAVRLFLEGRR